MSVHINTTPLSGFPPSLFSKPGKEGRYGIVIDQIYIVDVADTLDDARRKAVKWFKASVKYVREKPTLSIGIRGTDPTSYGYVTLSKKDMVIVKDNIEFIHDWNSGWKYYSKNIGHPFNPNTGKLIRHYSQPFPTDKKGNITKRRFPFNPKTGKLIKE